MTLNFLTDYIPLLAQGGALTTALWLCASLVSLSVGILLGVVRSTQFRLPFVSVCADFVTFIGRGIPFYVQLLIAYFVLPGLIGFDIPIFVIAVISLGFCSASYVSQSVRGAINTVPAGQWQAAQVLGLSKWQTGYCVIIPQIMPTLVPACVSECDQILKSTSIFASVGVLELTRVGMNMVSRTMNPIPIYLSIALAYLALSSLLNLVGYFVERTQNKGWL